jgi:hypothetical protein
LNHTIVHFEIPADNPEKLAGFYECLFGWRFEKMSAGDMGDYWIIETRAEEDSPGSNGGMMKKMDANYKPVNYFQVESVDEYAKKVEELGGKIVVPKTPIPDMGASAVALDPEGNTIGIYESSST